VSLVDQKENGGRNKGNLSRVEVESQAVLFCFNVNFHWISFAFLKLRPKIYQGKVDKVTLFLDIKAQL
jgi:hypothetical protein